MFVPMSLCLFNLKDGAGGRGGGAGGGTYDGCCEKFPAWLSKKKSLRVGGWKRDKKYVGSLGWGGDGKKIYFNYCYYCYCCCHFLYWNVRLFHEVS